MTDRPLIYLDTGEIFETEDMAPVGEPIAVLQCGVLDDDAHALGLAMAAAPQLLEAAQKARAALATAVIAHGGGLFHHNNVGEHRVVGLLDAAIAAATHA